MNRVRVARGLAYASIALVPLPLAALLTFASLQGTDIGVTARYAFSIVMRASMAFPPLGSALVMWLGRGTSARRLGVVALGLWGFGDRVLRLPDDSTIGLVVLRPTSGRPSHQATKHTAALDHVAAACELDFATPRELTEALRRSSTLTRLAVSMHNEERAGESASLAQCTRVRTRPKPPPPPPPPFAK
jgi:hypothetical protein